MHASGTDCLYLGGETAALVAASSVKNKVSHAEFNAAPDIRINTTKKSAECS